MKKLLTHWRNVSIAKKLYGLIGIMAILIIAELGVVWISVSALSGVRAFVAGEGMWSKAQKDAIFSLQTYAITRREKDYQDFLRFLEVADGDHLALDELLKENPDMEVVRQGFIRGNNHPDDIAYMIGVLRHLDKMEHVRLALDAWAQADNLLHELKKLGTEYYSVIKSNFNRARLNEIVLRIQVLNEELTVLENSFSNTMGEGSRWLEGVIITLLSIVVLTIGGTTLFLSLMATRSMTGRLAEISDVANAIGNGNLRRRIIVKGKDEVGVLATAINDMGETLQKSYRELETRVAERTEELSKAIRSRDEFLSIASHELRTPVTSMKLHVDMMKRSVEKNQEALISADKVSKLIKQADHGLNRISRLVEDMLDITRIQNGKLHIDSEPGNFSAFVRETLDRFEQQLKNAGIQVSLDLPEELILSFSHLRMEQVLANLISNAIRYAPNAPLRVELKVKDHQAILTFEDQGPGIAKENHERIFQRFERLVTPSKVSGLGLGLYIVQEIVRAHGGMVLVYSEDGKGARFIVELPVNNPLINSALT